MNWVKIASAVLFAEPITRVQFCYLVCGFLLSGKLSPSLKEAVADALTKLMLFG